MRTISTLSLLVLILAGCSKSVNAPPAVAVTGSVTLKGKPVSHAIVQFIPTSDGGQTGSAMTDDAGNYQLMSNKGQQGVPAGEYKVVITKKLGPDGKELPEGTSPFSGGGKETMPNFYSSSEDTILSAKVSPGSATVDFSLTGTNTSGGAMGGAMGGLRGGANANKR